MSAIALTGGIATGKSAVARRLAKAGVAVLDTDIVAAALTTQGGQAMPQIAAAFGAAFVAADGGLDRARMRDHVFADRGAKVRLEGILHPLIREEVDKFLIQASPRAAVAIPLFFESLSYRQTFRSVIVVDCRTDTQLARLVEQRGLSKDIATSIIGAQVPRQVRLQLADRVLSNDGLESALDSQVAALLGAWP